LLTSATCENLERGKAIKQGHENAPRRAAEAEHASQPEKVQVFLLSIVFTTHTSGERDSSTRSRPQAGQEKGCLHRKGLGLAAGAVFPGRGRPAGKSRRVCQPGSTERASHSGCEPQARLPWATMRPSRAAPALAPSLWDHILARVGVGRL